MEYTVNKLAQLSGLSKRTLHYYDDIGLLTPANVRSNGYRIYGKRVVDLLQQILFYRELGFSLDAIKSILTAPDFDREKALVSHVSALMKKKEQIETMIENVNKTINSMKGATVMSDKEKFEGFKHKLIDENEQNFGKEIREKYGDEKVNASNAKIKSMSKEQYEEAERLRLEINDALQSAMAAGGPAGKLAQKSCELHKQWLILYYPNYSKDYHKGLGEMYVADKRFRAYYEQIGDGCAEFLRDAINIYCD